MELPMNVERTLPPIVFSPWLAWSARKGYEHRRLPGVYLLARFEHSEPPAGNADPLAAEVIAIGETSSTLAARWRQFDREAFGEGDLHSVASRYRTKGYPVPDTALYAAAMPSSPLQWKKWAGISDDELINRFAAAGHEATKEDIAELRKIGESSGNRKSKGPENTAWVKFVERKLLLEYVLRWDKLPECNGE